MITKISHTALPQPPRSSERKMSMMTLKRRKNHRIQMNSQKTDRKKPATG